MSVWPGPEGHPVDSSALASSNIRERLDGLFWMDTRIMRTRAEVPPSMRVWVESSLGHVSRADIDSPLFWAGGFTSTIAAPVGNPRYDLLYMTPEVAGTLGIVTGTPAGSPTIPLTPTGKVPIAVLYLRPAMTSIKDLDDGINGYIFQRVQPFLGGNSIIQESTFAVSINTAETTNSLSRMYVKTNTVNQIVVRISITGFTGGTGGKSGSPSSSTTVNTDYTINHNLDKKMQVTPSLEITSLGNPFTGSLQVIYGR